MKLKISFIFYLFVGLLLLISFASCDKDSISEPIQPFTDSVIVMSKSSFDVTQLSQVK